MKKIDHLKIFSITLVLIGNLWTLNGCSESANVTNMYSTNMETSSIENENNEEIEEVEYAPINEEKSLYYEKSNSDKEVTLDDIFLTLKERGITINLNQEQLYNALYSNIDEFNQIISDEVNIILSEMDIEDSFEYAFLSESVTKKISEHTDLTLYDETNDAIFWEKLFDVVKKNNKDYLSSKADEWKWIKEYYSYEEYTDDEINIAINFFHNFYNQVKEDYPEFDTQTLACHLSELKLFHYQPNYSSIYVTWTNGVISTSKYSEKEYLDISLMEAYLIHEFVHYLTTTCSDGNQQNIQIVSTGVNFKDKYSCFLWKFLEEAIAHQYAQKVTGERLPFYEENFYLLDTINLINNLNNENNSILDSSIMHNPIQLIEQFNNPFSKEEQEIKWMNENLKMLACYETIYGDTLILFKEKVDIESEEILYGLEEIANLQLFRLAVTSISLNSNYTMKDSMYLLKIIEKRIHEQDTFFQKKYNLNDEHSNSYNSYYQEIQDTFLAYLEKEYNIDNAARIYQEFDYNDYYLNQIYGDYNNSLSYILQDEEYVKNLMRQYIKQDN